MSDVLNRILNSLSIENGVCVEMRASDGMNSITSDLWQRGWSAFLFEDDERLYDQLLDNVVGYEVITERVLVRNLDDHVDVRADVVVVDAEDVDVLNAVKIPHKVLVIKFSKEMSDAMKSFNKRHYKLVAVEKNYAFFVHTEDFNKFCTGG